MKFSILLEFKKKKKIELLSGGEKQRVSLVRAILKDSKMILCDEPTGSLDSENATNVFSLLKEVSKERLVLVVTHDRESAEKYQDGIIEISDGKVTAPVATIEEQEEDYQEEKGLRLSFGKRACFLIDEEETGKNDCHASYLHLQFLFLRHF